MPNMSYCRLFQNTTDDLIDCFNAMSGVDDNYQSRSDVSREELITLKNLVQVCKDVVELVENDEIVLLHYKEKVDPCNVEEDDNDY
jgi:hypothetical protein